MTAEVIDGVACAASIESSLQIRIDSLKQQGIIPHLAVVIVGEDPASHVYVRAKQRACERLGINSTRIDLPEETSFEQLAEIVQDLNTDDSVHGILVQSPLPNGINELAITDMIEPSKDVDGFHPVNLGRLVQSRDDGQIPCTPYGVMELLHWAGIELTGKRAVVIGRSFNVGMSQALLLAQKGADATVTIVHSKTQNPEEVCKEADILIAAVGVPEMVLASWIKPGAVVIDVGVNRVEDSSKERGYRLAGDVHPDVADVASALSPVPGGVGPMTIAMLMSNTVRSSEKKL
ncbi:MAG: bifunctional methylenetetrahydrofolate dehydrogenase/methenyltetrahydrofolate cyclohydrolase FolD [Candidatus Thalassarchaeaceae archaeon]|nr:bifunctional methylenetetrahydrofolate dehydrogenase/methenyltetrahydrofolate cyclohydrolase FolD [Candidatus Thalassarchaeaceae archaeon]|tara:strand:- start:3915 stop:4787 length:873 start_codon:yes stop_codon:yes gene_type:complete